MIPGIVAAGLAVTGEFEEPVSDATFADVVFLCSWNGADNATVATDDSLSAHTITFHGNAKLNTSVKQFGTASLELDGVGDYTSVASHSDFHFGTGPFCIEGFVRPDTSVFQDSTIVGMWTLDALVEQRGWRVSYTNEGLQFQYSADGDLVVTILSAPSTIGLNTQHHFCVQRNDNALMQLFVDGIEVDSATSAANLWPSTLDLTIGANFDTVVAADLSGHIDEVRITRNWWYDGDFTVPAAEYDRGIVAQGTLAATEGADLAAFEGPLVHEGTLAATDGADSAAIVSLWTPAALSSSINKGWWDAADAATITATGSEVDQWNDKSGNSNHVTAATTVRPDTGTVTIDGLNAIAFDGTDDDLRKLSGVALTSNDGMTLLCVRRHNSGTSGGVIMSLRTGSSLDVAKMGRDAGNFVIGGNGATSSASTQAAVADSDDTNPILWAGTIKTTGSSRRELFKNGTSVASDTDALTTQAAPDALYIGRMFRADRTLSVYANMDLGELIWLSGDGATNRQLAEGYLAWKWGLEGDLDAGHPYKAAAPSM